MKRAFTFHVWQLWDTSVLWFGVGLEHFPAIAYVCMVAGCKLCWTVGFSSTQWFLSVSCFWIHVAKKDLPLNNSLLTTDRPPCGRAQKGILILSYFLWAFVSAVGGCAWQSINQTSLISLLNTGRGGEGRVERRGEEQNQKESFIHVQLPARSTCPLLDADRNCCTQMCADRKMEKLVWRNVLLWRIHLNLSHFLLPLLLLFMSIPMSSTLHPIILEILFDPLLFRSLQSQCRFWSLRAVMYGFAVWADICVHPLWLTNTGLNWFPIILTPQNFYSSLLLITNQSLKGTNSCQVDKQKKKGQNNEFELKIRVIKWQGIN